MSKSFELDQNLYEKCYLYMVGHASKACDQGHHYTILTNSKYTWSNTYPKTDTKTLITIKTHTRETF